MQEVAIKINVLRLSGVYKACAQLSTADLDSTVQNSSLLAKKGQKRLENVPASSL